MKLFTLTGVDIRRLRQSTGLSQTAFAKRLGVSLKTIQNWENEVGSPSLLKFFKMCMVCNIKASQYVAALEQRKHNHEKVDLPKRSSSRD